MEQKSSDISYPHCAHAQHSPVNPDIFYSLIRVEAGLYSIFFNLGQNYTHGNFLPNEESDMYDRIRSAAYRNDSAEMERIAANSAPWMTADSVRWMYDRVVAEARA